MCATVIIPGAKCGLKPWKVTNVREMANSKTCSAQLLDKASKIPVNPRLSKSRSNSLDWDSDSAKTGTVKRRPVSNDFGENGEVCQGKLCPQINAAKKPPQKKKIEKQIPKPSNLHKRDRSLDFSASASEADKLLSPPSRPGKVSDSDSGINSPLSPGSVYGVFYPKMGFISYDDVTGVQIKEARNEAQSGKCCYSCVDERVEVGMVTKFSVCMFSENKTKN